MAAQYGVDVLGSLPLDMTIRSDIDSGEPTVARSSKNSISQKYTSIAQQVIQNLAEGGESAGPTLTMS